MNVNGKVVYVGLSGGFWGIEADNGQQYCPTKGLPKQFQKEGLKVQATVSPSQAFGIQMWGETVEIKKINTL